jgi:diguanylate cyclase (GGDEF)-like protein/PAS domain S-box-containing protein
MSGKGRELTQQTLPASALTPTPEPNGALQSQLAAIIEATPDGVVLIDPQGHFHYLNPAARTLLGIEADEGLSTLTLQEFCPGAVREHLPSDVILTAITVGQWRSELELTARTGRTFPALLACFAHKERDATVPFLSLIIRDISDQKRREAELTHLAHHDALTRLFNRLRFQEELESRLAQVRRYGGQGTLLLLDIDHFKTVNDTFGHQAGDMVLVTLANLLREQLREVDIIARLGGDEFAVLLYTLDSRQALAVARRLLHAIRNRSVRVADQELHYTVSIGIALFPEQGGTVETIMKHADLALYRAKIAGRDQYQLFSQAMTP